MTITIRQKALANDNISLYLDIYDGGKRKFEFFLSICCQRLMQRPKQETKKHCNVLTR